MTDKQRAQTAARQQRFRQRQALARRGEQQARGLPPMPAIPTMPGNSRWRAALENAYALLNQVNEEMRVYLDERSDAWRESDAGAAMGERNAALEDVLAQLDDLRA